MGRGGAGAALVTTHCPPGLGILWWGIFWSTGTKSYPVGRQQIHVGIKHLYIGKNFSLKIK